MKFWTLVAVLAISSLLPIFALAQGNNIATAGLKCENENGHCIDEKDTPKCMFPVEKLDCPEGNQCCKTFLKDYDAAALPLTKAPKCIQDNKCTEVGGKCISSKKNCDSQKMDKLCGSKKCTCCLGSIYNKFNSVIRMLEKLSSEMATNFTGTDEKMTNLTSALDSHNTLLEKLSSEMATNFTGTDEKITSLTSALDSHNSVLEKLSSEMATNFTECSPNFIQEVLVWNMNAAINRSILESTSNTTCGSLKDRHGLTGVISVGSTSVLYENNMRCEWHVTTPPGTTILITFNRLDTERCRSCSTCDYVEAMDYSTNISFLPEPTLCGRDNSMVPLAASSSTNKVVIRFRTDYGATYHGFDAIYQAVFHNECSSNYIQEGLVWNMNAAIDGSILESTSNTTCGSLKDRHGLTGVISVGSTSVLYENNTRCEWHVTTPPGTTILITFNRLDIEGARASCSHDWVEAMDYSTNISFLPEPKLCGRNNSLLPLAASSSTNKVVFKFRTDSSGTYHGFDAMYQAVFHKDP